MKDKLMNEFLDLLNKEHHIKEGMTGQELSGQFEEIVGVLISTLASVVFTHMNLIKKEHKAAFLKEAQRGTEAGIRVMFEELKKESVE